MQVLLLFPLRSPLFKQRLSVPSKLMLLGKSIEVPDWGVEVVVSAKASQETCVRVG